MELITLLEIIGPQFPSSPDLDIGKMEGYDEQPYLTSWHRSYRCRNGHRLPSFMC